MNPTQGAARAAPQLPSKGLHTAIGFRERWCVASGQAAETLAILNVARGR